MHKSQLSSEHPKHQTLWWGKVFNGRRHGNERYMNGPTSAGPNVKRLTNRAERRTAKPMLKEEYDQYLEDLEREREEAAILASFNDDDWFDDDYEYDFESPYDDADDQIDEYEAMQRHGCF